MKIKYLASTLFFLAMSVPVAASEVEVDVIAGGWSIHHNAGEKDYNQVHEGFGVEANGYVIQQYHNSIRNKSVVVGKYVGEVNFGPYIRYRGLVAAVSGYNSTGAVPAYLPTVSVDYKRLGVDFIVLPGVVSYAQVRFNNVASFDNPYDLPDEKDRDNAISYSYGSVGSNLSYWRRINGSFDVRVTGSNGFFGRAEDAGDKSYRFDEYLETETYGVIGAWYPFENRWLKPFAIEAGVLKNGIDYNAGARHWVGVSQLSSYDAFVSYDWEPYSGYVGVRYGMPWNKSLGGYVQFGLMSLHGGKMMVEGPVEEYTDLSLDVEDLKYYPVLQFGLTHTF